MVGGTGYSTHSTPGHSNRIFSLKFHPLDSNTIVSGETLPPLSDPWVREVRVEGGKPLSALSVPTP